MSNWYIDFLNAYGDIQVKNAALTETTLAFFFPEDLKTHQDFLTAHGHIAAYGLVRYIIHYLKIRQPSRRAVVRIHHCLSEELRLISCGFYEINSVDDLGNYRERLPIAVK